MEIIAELILLAYDHFNNDRMPNNDNLPDLRNAKDNIFLRSARNYL